jgi:hypothetical protein
MLIAQEIAPGLINAEDHLWTEGKYYYLLGVKSKKSVWFWFKLYSDGILIFDHAYSQINGTTDKSTAARTRGENLLTKL